MFLHLLVVNAGRRPWTGQWLSNLSQKCQPTDHLGSPSQAKQKYITAIAYYAHQETQRFAISQRKMTYSDPYTNIQSTRVCSRRMRHPCERYGSVGQVIPTNGSDSDFGTAWLTGLDLTPTPSGKPSDSINPLEIHPYSKGSGPTSYNF